MAKFCSSCGKPLRIGEKFCSSCGAAVDGQKTTIPSVRNDISSTTMPTKKTSGNKSKITAMLLAFFTGGLGGHKFYLGEKKAGIIYLLLFWTGIPVLISIYDLVKLIMMSDDEFDKEYNQ